MAGTGLRTAGGRPATQSAGEADGKGEGLRETGLGAAEVSVSRCQTGPAVGRWGDGVCWRRERCRCQVTPGASDDPLCCSEIGPCCSLIHFASLLWSTLTPRP